jgi:hypothetical protein
MEENKNDYLDQPGSLELKKKKVHHAGSITWKSIGCPTN